MAIKLRGKVAWEFLYGGWKPIYFRLSVPLFRIVLIMINNALDGLKLSQTIKTIKIMGRELSDVFKAKTRDGKRRVLDKFDISKDDKNKFLNGIESSSGGGGEASTIEYLDLRRQSLSLINAVMAFAIQAKANISPDELRITYMYTASDVTFDNIVECSIDFNGYVYNKQVGLKNVCDFLSMANITQEQLDAIPRITKEQFYSFEQSNTINFTFIDSHDAEHSLTAQRNITWREFIDSENSQELFYNRGIDDYVYADSFIPGGYLMVGLDGVSVKLDDVIVDNGQYTTVASGGE